MELISKKQELASGNLLKLVQLLSVLISVKLIVPVGGKVLTSNCTHLVRSCFKIAF